MTVLRVLSFSETVWVCPSPKLKVVLVISPSLSLPVAERVAVKGDAPVVAGEIARSVQVGT